MHIENIIIGKPKIHPKELLATDFDDWINIESHKTKWTNERYLPKILVEYGFIKSISELKRNRPDLCLHLNELNFLQIKIGKRKIWIIVGE